MFGIIYIMPYRKRKDVILPQRALYLLCRQNLPRERCLWEYTGAIPGRRFRIDIAFPDYRIAVEVDGWQYHGQHKGDFQRDRDRQNLLVLHRWRLLRFTAGDLYRRPGYAVNTIRTLLDQLRPAPHNTPPSSRAPKSKP